VAHLVYVSRMEAVPSSEVSRVSFYRFHVVLMYHDYKDFFGFFCLLCYEHVFLLKKPAIDINSINLYDSSVSLAR